MSSATLEIAAKIGSSGEIRFQAPIDFEGSSSSLINATTMVPGKMQVGLSKWKFFCSLIDLLFVGTYGSALQKML